MSSRSASLGQLGWTIRRGMVRLGRAGVIGMLLLLGALAILLLAIEPAHQRLGTLADEQARLQAQMMSREPSRERPTVRGQLSDFYAFFPATDSVPRALGTVHKAARRHDLTLEKGEYKLVREPNFPLLRYQVTLPVAGRYADIRGFVNRVLDSLPNAAVDQLILKRDDIGAGQIEARVRFSLYLGEQP